MTNYERAPSPDQLDGIFLLLGVLEARRRQLNPGTMTRGEAAKLRADLETELRTGRRVRRRKVTARGAGVSEPPETLRPHPDRTLGEYHDAKTPPPKGWC